MEDKYICRYCGKECKNANSLRNHERLCKSNPNRQQINLWGWSKGRSRTGKSTKGMIHVTDGVKNRTILPIEFEEFIKIHPNWRRGHTQIRTIPNLGIAKTPKAEEDRKRKISETMKKNLLAGGRRQGSGRGKKGWYRGIFCDSSWELAYLIYCLDHNISIKRCEEKREYLYNDEKHIYLPDFVVNGQIVEIKGYKTKQWLEKLKQNPDILVLYEDDMKPYLDYVINKYGKDYIRLYEHVQQSKQKRVEV